MSSLSVCYQYIGEEGGRIMSSLSVYWDLTYKCNLNCIHCSATDYRSEKIINKLICMFDSPVRTELRYENVSRFLEFMENNRLYDFKVYISPHRGESTIHPDFLTIWNELSSISTIEKLSLMTNGTTLYKLIEKMELSKLKNISVSLDGGNKETHDRIRGRGTFEKVMKSLSVIEDIKNNDPDFYLQVNFVINRINAKTLGDLFNIIENINIKNILINIIPVILIKGNAKNNRSLLALPFSEMITAMSKAYTDFRHANEKRASRGLPLIKLRFDFSPKQYFVLLSKLKSFEKSTLILPHKTECKAKNSNLMYITPFGNILPCGHFAELEVLSEFYKNLGKTKPPHVFDVNSVQDIMESTFFINARKWITNLEKTINFTSPCSSCPFKGSCNACPIYLHIWGVPDGEI